MSNSLTNRYKKVFFVTLFVALPIIFLSLFGEIFYLVVFSVALTMILKPLIDFLEDKGLPRVLAILILYLLLGSITTIGLIIIYPIIIFQISQLSTSFDMEHLNKLMIQFSNSISEFTPFLSSEEISNKILSAIPALLQKISSLTTSMLSVLASLIIIPFITFFLLNDYYNFQKKIIESVPNKYFEVTLNIVSKLEDQLSKYIRGVAIESFIVGLLYTFAYWFLGIEYALVLGILGGVVNIIPFAGPFIAAVPVILLSLLQLGDTRLILPIIVVSFIVQQLDEIFIQPNVYGKILNIHPLTIILVILIANELLGVGGMIVAIPIYTIISVTAKETNWGLSNFKITQD
ncbi:MAG: AI-2E family transporter [Bacteroidota bacterium]